MKKDELDELDALALMRKRFQDAEEAETLNRISAEDSLRFYFGDQWADEIERERKADGRPCFTLNKLPAILKQVINESRQNPPAIQISPVADGADEDKAEALQGLTRHVEQNGEGAAVAYETAFTYLCIGGFASWRVLHDFLPMSFDQDLSIARIRNPFSVYWDPASQKLDKSDARYCFITTDFSNEAYADEFPDSELVGLTDFSGVGDRAPGWASKSGCRTVEYFYIESEDVQLVKIESGRNVYEDEIPEGSRIAKGPDGKPISRPDVRKTAWVAVSNGVEWLKKPEELPTNDIPVVSIFGDELIVDGDDRLKGMVYDLEEPGRLFNYNSSAIAETMAVGSKANWVATAEQIEPYMALWKQANNRAMAVLPYKHVPGVLPPSKISSEPPIEAMSAARLQSADDLRSISGVYDATQSPNGGEESGRAVLARRHQTSTGNVNWAGNLGRGVRRTAQILLKYFPVIYDTARVMRILGIDQQPKQIIVHAAQPEGVAGLMTDGIKGVFDLTVGTYDVVAQLGRGDESKRQEAVDMLLSLAQAAPMIIPVIGDLIVNEMDFAGKKAIVARMQKALPPGLQDNQNPTDPAQLQAHNTQMMQQNQKLMAQVQQLTQVVQTKQIEANARQAVANTQLQSAQVSAASRVDQANITAQASILKEKAGKQFDATHDHAMADKSHIHNTMAADQAHAHSIDSSERAAALAPPAEPLPKAA
jgi:hypothetical protein